MISSNVKTFHHLLTSKNMIFELTLISLRNENLRFDVAVAIAVVAVNNDDAVAVAFSSPILSILVTVDLSIHLEQMDIRNGSTLSNGAFASASLIPSNKARFDCSHSFTKIPFSISTVLATSRCVCVYYTIHCERCFRCEARFFWLLLLYFPCFDCEMKWKRTDWCIEMSAKDEIALGKRKNDRVWFLPVVVVAMFPHRIIKPDGWTTISEEWGTVHINVCVQHIYWHGPERVDNQNDLNNNE